MFSFYWCCFLARLFSWTFLIFVYQILSFASLLSINLYCCWRGCVSPRLSCLNWPVFHWGFLSLFRNHRFSLRFSSTFRSQSSHKSLRFLDCFSTLLFSRIAVSWSYQLSQHPPISFSAWSRQYVWTSPAPGSSSWSHWSRWGWRTPHYLWNRIISRFNWSMCNDAYILDLYFLEFYQRLPQFFFLHQHLHTLIAVILFLCYLFS